jgi:alpha-amylase/alpha-mannosidase (GH57 family)
LAEPLYVAFVWHMHQPLYKDTLTGQYSLPWVRLHAVKDYLHMAEGLADYPEVHATFNFAPCLVEQLNEYAEGQAVDQALAVSGKEEWTQKEKEFILSYFFNIHWDNIVRRHARYNQLLELRQQVHGEASLLSDYYYRDLVAWFNLAWIDPNWLERDQTLRSLVEKELHFSAEDIRLILAKQREIIKRILPLYRELEAAGQVELITSPYYHPILPLLIDSHLARQASPDLPLPRPAFAHIEDAEEQIRRAVSYHRDHFGSQPRGMWPPEGAVCQELVPILARQGFTWFASDEGVLARSLRVNVERDEYGHVKNPTVLYQPYQHQGEGQAVAVLFRDRLLSDRIGFVYGHMEGHQAAEDLVHRLHRIRENLADPENPYLVSIILDGENCWEQYEHNGDVFLRHLYSLLSDDPDLKAVTVSHYLAQHPPRRVVPQLSSGSWIGANLETWIGERAQNQAWAYLAHTRDRLVAWQSQNPAPHPDSLARAWEEIYIAEGSDWFWWYYSHNNPGDENLFDQEFHLHLGNVYRLSGLPWPGWLSKPIVISPEEVRSFLPAAYISPHLSATESTPPEWQRAGRLEMTPSTGTMQRAYTILRCLLYGYDPEHLYLRLEANERLNSYSIEIYLSTPDSKPTNRQPRYAGTGSAVGWTWKVALSPTEEEEKQEVKLNRADGQEGWQPMAALQAVALSEKVVELAIPLHDLGLKLNDAVRLSVNLLEEGVLIETLPHSTYHSFELVPGDENSE